ncbi:MULTISPECIES: MBL fold metallo-hydrolase [Actinomycetes]|uniref:MBL fold metallo-hydrolase n=1 Tax=Actinomycetes TaxID=1760 RepID=UPI0035CB9FE9
MRLTVIGCSGSTSGPDSPASSYLVQAPYQGRTYSLVLDLGPGAFGRLWAQLDPREVDAIALTHLHPDHCLDLCAFYVGARYSPTAPWAPVPVLGPSGTRERIVRAYEVTAPGVVDPEPGPGIGEHFGYRDWRPEQRLGPFVVETVRVDHPVETYALRVTGDGPGGGTLVYSGDTGPCPALVELARDADLLLAEAAFLDRPGNPTGLHLSGREAAETAAAAGVRRLVLTHIPPWHDPDRVLAEAAPHYQGPIELARSACSWTVGARP